MEQNKSTLYDDIRLSGEISNKFNSAEDMFILLGHSFNGPFDKVICSHDLNELEEYLKDILEELNLKYSSVSNFESFNSTPGHLRAFKGYWLGHNDDSEDLNFYFYEYGIIKADKNFDRNL